MNTTTMTQEDLIRYLTTSARSATALLDELKSDEIGRAHV